MHPGTFGTPTICTEMYVFLWKNSVRCGVLELLNSEVGSAGVIKVLLPWSVTVGFAEILVNFLLGASKLPTSFLPEDLLGESEEIRNEGCVPLLPAPPSMPLTLMMGSELLPHDVTELC